jgi:hypothetical protein
MLGFLACIVMWYLLDHYTDLPWFIKFCIVFIVVMLLF